MALLELINKYQTLIGSFLGIIFSVGFWFLKMYFDKKRQIMGSKKEIERIFFMAARESEDALRDLKMYVEVVCKNLGIKEAGMDVFLPPKFNRIYINEERLFMLSQNLDFMISQQIDIATSSAKKFNGYLDQFESAPIAIFEYTIKMLQTGMISKDKVSRNYDLQREKYIKHIEHIIDNYVEILQKHLLRPIVAQNYKESNLWSMPPGAFDEMLDAEAGIMLGILKKESA